MNRDDKLRVTILNFTKEDLINIKEKCRPFLIEAADFFADEDERAKIKVKSRNNFVTEVDLKVQEFLRKKLAEILPDAKFYAEEKDNEDIDLGDFLWILDPCDGTTNLIHDYKHSTISLALAKGGELLLGLVYEPHAKELFWAIRGGGAYLNDKKISVSKIPDIKSSIIGLGAGGARIGRVEETFEMIKDIFITSQGFRRIGSAALEMCYVAAGRTDGYLEEDLKLWDYAAGLLLIKEAGGLVLNFHGEDLSLERISGVICANKILIKELLKYKY